MDLNTFFCYLVMTGFATPFLFGICYHVYEYLTWENHYINGQRNPVAPHYVRVESEDEFYV